MVTIGKCALFIGPVVKVIPNDVETRIIIINKSSMRVHKACKVRVLTGGTNSFRWGRKRRTSSLALLLGSFDGREQSKVRELTAKNVVTALQYYSCHRGLCLCQSVVQCVEEQRAHRRAATQSTFFYFFIHCVLGRSMLLI